MLQYEKHHIRTNTNTTKDYSKKIYRKVKSSNTKHKNLHKQEVNAYIYVLANIKLDKIQTNYLVSEQLPIFRKTVSLKCPQEEGMGDFKNHAFVTAPKQ